MAASNSGDKGGIRGDFPPIDGRRQVSIGGLVCGSRQPVGTDRVLGRFVSWNALALNMPLEFAEPTEKQLIDEVLDLDSGQFIAAPTFIRRELRTVMQDRSTIVSRLHSDAENPWLVCPYCMAAVYLVSALDRHFFFRHRIE